MRSMTGYGSAEIATAEFDFTVEIKTVNSRHFDFKARLARELSGLEAELKAEVQKELRRGRIELYVEVRPTTADQYELNLPVVENYRTLAEQASKMGIPGVLEVSDLLSIPGLVMPRTEGLVSDEMRITLLRAVRAVVKKVVTERESEGAALREELQRRISLLRGHLAALLGHAAGIREHFESRLKERVRELSEQVVVDEPRLNQEILYYIEKADISEEMARLESHISRFEKCLSPGDGLPVGKKLDFLCQELNREVNTILSKSVLVEVSEVGIEAKAEVERLREQVQNVE